ncbi:MAG: DUF4158 domain-containing protein [Actinomycetota bacterium]|nr:DUF4158 domain-containing protein [Actinomycetota bacterium]
MKRSWTEEELVERWTLFPDELALIGNKTGRARLGFAVMLRFFAGEGRFPRDKHEVPVGVLRFVGEQVGAGPDAGPANLALMCGFCRFPGEQALPLEPMS